MHIPHMLDFHLTYFHAVGMRIVQRQYQYSEGSIIVVMLRSCSVMM
jgi:hypothetical protein